MFYKIIQANLLFLTLVILVNLHFATKFTSLSIAYVSGIFYVNQQK